MMFWSLVPAAGLVAFLLTALALRYAVVNQMLDIPNDRSSHSSPTPRGGGIAIVIAFIFGLSLLYFSDVFNGWLVFGTLVAGASIAVTGFIDDHKDLSAKWRLLVHFIAAAFALYSLDGGLQQIVFLGHNISSGWIVQILTLIYLVWLLNLFNFMDGIDGIASIEAVSVSLGGGILLILLGSPEAAILPFILCGAAFGFLLWNFPPAKIFMGDVGSGFLGFIIGVLSLHAAQLYPVLLWSWIILLGVFIVDATFTLIKRMLKGENVSKPHRNHAYQRAARLYRSHKIVSVAVGVINLFWLFPWAVIVAMDYIDGALAVVIAYIPLIITVLKFDALENVD